MKTLLQPSEQTRLCRTQFDTGHTNLGESQFLAPGLYLRNQLVAVPLSTLDRHLPIVESPVLAEHTLVWSSEEDTRRFAEQWSRSEALRNAFVALHGNLGAGKTTLVRYLLQALGVQGRIKSPTYAVVEPYELPERMVWHFDFYRFSDPQEWEDAGFRDLFAASGLKLAEWPDKVGALLPLPDLDLCLSAQDDDSRHVTLKAHTPVGQALIQASMTDTSAP